VDLFNYKKEVKSLLLEKKVQKKLTFSNPILTLRLKKISF